MENKQKIKELVDQLQKHVNSESNINGNKNQDESIIVRKNISITLKQQKMLDEMSKNNYEINLSASVRREIQKQYNEYKFKK